MHQKFCLFIGMLEVSMIFLAGHMSAETKIQATEVSIVCIVNGQSHFRGHWGIVSLAQHDPRMVQHVKELK